MPLNQCKSAVHSCKKPLDTYVPPPKQAFSPPPPRPLSLSKVVYCFSCGKVGILADLHICTLCEEAYYCDRNCHRAHAKVHHPVCVATVAAKAQHAHRVRVVRAVREKGKANVEGGKEDDLCVICMEAPEAAVEVRLSDSIQAVKQSQY